MLPDLSGEQLAVLSPASAVSAANRSARLRLLAVFLATFSWIYLRATRAWSAE